MQEARFEQVREEMLRTKKEQKGIGTLAEKTVHAMVKQCYATDIRDQEIPIAGYVADIYNGKEIIEIQTRNMQALRPKLERFLEICPVTVVHPIPHIKWLIWIDEETGEMTQKRKSPTKGSEYQAFKELYKIKPFLKKEGFTLKLLLLDMEEYRLLNGWSKDRKKGSTRYDRMPLKFVRETILMCKEDYRMFIPAELEDGFSVRDFAKMAHIKVDLAQVVVHILHEMEVVVRSGKRGNAWLYDVVE